MITKRSPAGSGRYSSSRGWTAPPACFATNDNGVQSLAKAQPDLVVMVLGPQTEHVLEVLGELRRLVQTRILVVGPASSKLVLRALRGGADDYVDESDLEAELQAALKRLKEARFRPRDGRADHCCAGPVRRQRVEHAGDQRGDRVGQGAQGSRPRRPETGSG